MYSPLSPLSEDQNLLILTFFGEKESLDVAANAFLSTSNYHSLQPFIYKPIDETIPFAIRRFEITKEVIKQYEMTNPNPKVEWIIITDITDVFVNSNRNDLIQAFEKSQKDLIVSCDSLFTHQFEEDREFWKQLSPTKSLSKIYPNAGLFGGKFSIIKDLLEKCCTWYHEKTYKMPKLPYTEFTLLAKYVQLIYPVLGDKVCLDYDGILFYNMCINEDHKNLKNAQKLYEPHFAHSGKICCTWLQKNHNCQASMLVHFPFIFRFQKQGWESITSYNRMVKFLFKHSLFKNWDSTSATENGVKFHNIEQ